MNGMDDEIREGVQKTLRDIDIARREVQKFKRLKYFLKIKYPEVLKEWETSEKE